MARKVHLDDRKRRRREEKESFRVCEIQEVAVVNPPYLSEETESAAAAALFDVVVHPEKYKELQEE